MSIIRKAYNTIFASDKELLSYIKSITGVTPSNLRIYKQVFQHRSKFTDAEKNNERLELLGDSVLDMLVAEYLYRKYPYREEGFMTEMRSKIVNRKSLNDVGERLGLLDKLEINRKTMNDVAKDLSGNTFEALVGAVYLDAGFEATKKFIFKRVLNQLVDVENLETTQIDFKSNLYKYAQRFSATVEFKTLSDQKRGKRSYFVVSLELNGNHISQGEGYSKKIAEQNASMNAFKMLEVNGTLLEENTK